MAKFVMSVDDGCRHDLRIAQLAKKYAIECTFYWPVNWTHHALAHGYEPLSYREALEIAEKHEIGSHTITHRHLTKLDLEDAVSEVVESKLMLTRLFPNNVINKFCPPRGYTNEILTEATLGVYDSQRLTKGEGLVHIHPNSGANNNMDWREYAKTVDVKEIWGHSWEIEKYNLWQQLEDFLYENTHSEL